MTSPSKKRKTNPPARWMATPDSPSNRNRKTKASVTRHATAAKNVNLEANPGEANPGVQEKAKIVVGVDIGTTFSGFAYSSNEDPEKVFTFYDWPSQEAGGPKSYCKTQTSLRYRPGKLPGTFELHDWGWPAYLNHLKELQDRKKAGLTAIDGILGKRLLSTCGRFITKFKLCLPYAGLNFASQSCKIELPEGFSVERLMTDYLKQLSAFIMKELNNKFGKSILKKNVQWCLTVPSIATNAAKQTMIKCAEMAGLARGQYCRDENASLYPILIVLEPEAASVYCLRKLKGSHDLRKGSKHLVVDAGGGTVDLVAHEVLDDSGLRLKELTRSTGDLCGGTFVDDAFKTYLARKIACFRKFSEEYPTTVLAILGYWESLKYNFDDGKQESFDLELPKRLGSAWEAHDKRSGSWRADNQYEELEITREDMKRIFDGQVDKILRLIHQQVALVPEIGGIMVVGGFSNSPYLMKRIRDKFSDSVKYITSPIDPGSAVCQGAVAFGAHSGQADIMMSRKSRKTYGVNMFRPFRKGDPLGSNVCSEDGILLCKNAFDVFACIGDDVPVEHCVSRVYEPFNTGDKSITFTMYSTNDPAPAFVTDAGVEPVGSWTYPIPPEAQRMKEHPSVEIEMFFGRTHIQMSAKPKNFRGVKKSMFSVVFERELRDDLV